jgi:outer membrane protein
MRGLGVIIFCTLAAAPVAAQSGVPAPVTAPATLTLQEAIDLARKNNPDYLSQANDVIASDWSVRSAYGQLLPSASAGTSYSYSAAGNQRIATAGGSDISLAQSTDYYSSSASLSLSYRLSGQSLLQPGLAKSNRTATVANIDLAGFNLKANVTRQYLAVLRAQESLVLAERELASAKENKALADAKVAGGMAIPMESTQAAVQVGRTEVGVLQARNSVQTAKMALLQLMGIQYAGDIQLTTSFGITELPATVEQLTAIAMQQHPALRAALASDEAAKAGYKMAKTAYLPSLGISTGLSGFMRQAGNPDFLIQQARDAAEGTKTQCDLLMNISNGLKTPLPGAPTSCDISLFRPTPAEEQSIRDANKSFPFGYQSEPMGVSLSISLPLFDGFNRERQLETQKVAVTDAQLRTRSQELKVRTDVATAYANASTARQSVDLEARNRDLATQQLELARVRYRVQSGTFLELNDAETVKARADQSYINALYSYHEALSALETAVGQPLSQVTGGNR